MPPPVEKVERIHNSDDSQHTASSSEKIERDVEKGEDASPEGTEFNEHAKASRGGSLAALSQRSGRSQKYTDDGKRIMQEEDCWDKLGYQWPTWKKVRTINFMFILAPSLTIIQWMLLTSIFSVQ